MSEEDGVIKFNVNQAVALVSLAIGIVGLAGVFFVLPYRVERAETDIKVNSAAIKDLDDRARVMEQLLVKYDTILEELRSDER